MAEFKSKYGWRMQLPEGWEPLEAHDSKTMEKGLSQVFACADDWSLSITWMQKSSPVEARLASRFAALTSLCGRLPSDEMAELLDGLFPAIGKIEEATAVELPGGRQGLETIESFEQNHERKKGYQLIFAGAGTKGMLEFQRLCFYAPSEQFNQMIPVIQKSCQSFSFCNCCG